MEDVFVMYDSGWPSSTDEIDVSLRVGMNKYDLHTLEQPLMEMIVYKPGVLPSKVHEVLHMHALCLLCLPSIIVQR